MRTAFITGASGGIGGRLAARLTQDGWRVLGAARGNALLPDKVERIALDLRRALPRRGRRPDRRSDGRARARRSHQLRRRYRRGAARARPLAEFRRQFDVNVAGPFALIRGLAPELRQARGRIVNIGAASAHVTPPFFGPIAASKAALASLSDAARLELAAFGVRVVLIEPGALRTGIFETSRRAQTEAMAGQSPQIVALYRRAIEAAHEALSKLAPTIPTSSCAPR
jgi:NAD(P)-dependent dehydrogenase (short-subunit alcohol dehydrogenase family)